MGRRAHNRGLRLFLACLAAPCYHPAMRLREYLHENAIKVSDFAASIGVKQNTVSGWLSGARRPDLDMAFRIENETGGAVPAQGWCHDK